MRLGRRWLPVWLLLAFSSPGLGQTSDVEPSPAQSLRDNYGLSQAAVGKIWVLERERSLREAVTGLTKLRGQVVAGTKAMSDVVERNSRRWEADRLRRERLRKQRAQLRSDDPERARITRQLQQLQKNSVPPNELPTLPEAQRIAIELTRARDRLTLQVAALKRKTQQLTRAYKVLREDARVQQLLGKVGKANRLGPTQDFLRVLSGIEACVNTNFVPIFDQSGHLRFSGIVNDRTPLTFTWVASVSVPVVPARVIESAQLQLGNSRLRRRQLPNGRQVEVRRARLERLRFGEMTLKDVVVDVLSPDSEDVGAVIGRAAFSPLKVELHPATLRLQLAQVAAE